MGFDSKRSLEIGLESARELLKKYENMWNETRAKEAMALMEDQQKYVGDLAYELQRWNMHDELVENGFMFDREDEDTIIEFASMWSMDVCEVAEKMEQKDLRKIPFEEYVEEYVVGDYASRAGKEGIEIFREFQRWLPTDELKEFVKNHYTDGEEYIVENFDDDYIIIMNP